MRRGDHHPSRRQMLITAGLAGGVLCLGAWVRPATRELRVRDQRSGLAFGTVVSIRAEHAEAATLKAGLDAAWREIEAVEQAASLYRANSALSELNRTGILETAPPTLIDLITASLDVARMTDGAFDLTVQPLWRLHADCHAAGRRATAAELEAVGGRIGWRHVAVAGSRVTLERPGMAVTLNGIAQGYATERVLFALRAHGIEDAFVDTGEIGVEGKREGVAPWTAGIADPRQTGAFVGLSRPASGVLATSGDYATAWSADFSHHHILDPRTLQSPPETASVSVLAPSGALADGLATAMMVMGPARSLALARRLSGVEALIVTKNGAVMKTDGFPIV